MHLHLYLPLTSAMGLSFRRSQRLGIPLEIALVRKHEGTFLLWA